MIDWFWEFDLRGSKSLWREMVWMLRYGQWGWMRNKPWQFGAARIWYDGPHWCAHFGPFGVSVSAA